MTKNSRRLHEHHATTGLAPRGLASKIRFGAVFLVPDAIVVFPEERLAAAGPRSEHALRPVIVLQATKLGNVPRPLTVLVAPVSTSPQARSEAWNVPVYADTPGFDKPGTAYVALSQPILKEDLKIFKAYVDFATKDALLTALSVVFRSDEP